MATSVLATKLYAPPPPHKVVSRPRLIARLNEGLYRKLSLLSAPAGFGKTTLMSEWLGACERPAAWLSLDEGDNVPARFLTHLIAALQTVTNLKEDVSEHLRSSSPSTEATLTVLLNEIASAPSSFILILDDYHVINAEAVDEALVFLIEHLPPQMHLVVATREDPQLPLARLRARGQLSELRADDLRFSPSEAAKFLNRGMDLDLSAEDVSTLERRTEGWIAGLQLAALSLQGREDTVEFIKTFAGDHRYVIDYLLEEVLQRQSERVRSFLLETASLERLCGSLCDAVTGLEDGGETLSAIERGNLFLVPLDDKRHWYRYHHLFADVLRARLREERLERVPTLHLRASAWFEKNDLRAEAIHHALAAEDAERSARLIELAWRGMDRTFQFATWLRWVKKLPDTIVRARPVLSVGYAWALLSSGQFEEAEARLIDAEQLPANDGPPPKIVVIDEEEYRSLPVTIASARAYKAQALGDVGETIRHASAALKLLSEDDHLGRAIPLSLRGMAYWANGELEAAHRSLAEGMDGFAKTDNVMAAISGAFGLADMRVAQGRLSEAIRDYEAALKLASDRDEPVVRGTAILHLGLSEVYRERGELDVAERHLSESEARGEHDTQHVYQYRRSLVWARLSAAKGDFDGALALLDEAVRLAEQLHVPDLRPAGALKASIWVTQNALPKALVWVRERGLSADDDLSYLHEFEHITLARVLIAEYQSGKERAIEDALKLLRRLLEAALAGGRMGSAIDILVVRALAYQARRDEAAALISLGQSLTLAEPEGYVRTFVNEGSPMATLLSRTAAQDGAPDYVATLLAAFERKEDTPASSPSASLVEPLSKRELEVLQLVSQGLSNREIGKRLFRALDTVKGHNRRIYGKLQVKNRTEAVARARELGLL